MPSRKKRGYGGVRKRQDKSSKNNNLASNRTINKKLKIDDIEVVPLVASVPLTPNQRRQIRKINRRRVIDNAEVALLRHLLKIEQNAALTNDDLVAMLEPELDDADSNDVSPSASLYVTPPCINVGTGIHSSLENPFRMILDWYFSSHGRSM